MLHIFFCNYPVFNANIFKNVAYLDTLESDNKVLIMRMEADLRYM